MQFISTLPFYFLHVNYKRNMSVPASSITTSYGDNDYVEK